MLIRNLTWSGALGVGALAFAASLVACGDSSGGGAAGRGNQDSGVSGGSGGGSSGSGGAGSGGSGGSSGMGGGSSATGCADVTCANNATCSDSGDTATCECDSGYTGDGDTSCDDIDECADGSDDCDTHASCTNMVGSFTCACDVGYEGDGTDCSDADECAENTDTCDPNAECSNEVGSFDCACGAGYDGDGFGCGDIDECADSSTFECADNASCRNTFGAYACDCDPLYVGDGKTECDGLCDIALNNPSVCNASGVCRITDEMGASCDACTGGLVGDGRTCDVPTTGVCGPQCDGIDGSGADAEVENAICCDGAPSDDPDTACVEATSAGCQCAPGFTGTPATGCTDIDECADANGGCSAHSDCQNLPGGYICVCDAGYRKNSSGECVDIDECEALPFPCHPNAKCTDTDGGFTCECKDGYEGDGGTCKDINECAAGTDDCADGETCKNTSGGFVCEDVDECALGLDNCDANASCSNDNPGFQCECDDGFNGDGSKCVCDLSGYWAMRQDATLVWPAQKLQGLTTVACGCVKTTIWELHRYDYNGKLIEVQKKGCGSESGPDLVSPLFGNGETYSSYVPFETFDAVDLEDDKQAGVDVPLVDAVPGLRYSTPKEAAVVGIDLGDDPLNAAWPAANELVNAEGGDAPAWVDDDDDGVPGLTLWPAQSTDEWFGAKSGDNCGGGGQRSCSYDYFPVNLTPGPPVAATERAGCVSAATRVVTRLDAEIESCDRIVGDLINVKAEGRFATCLRVGPTFTPPGNPPSAWAGEVSCTASDWENGTRCTEFNVDVFDNAGQSQSSGATFELVKIADLDDSEPTCDDVRTSLPELGVRACSDACDDN